MHFRAKVLNPAMQVQFIELDASNADEAHRFVTAPGNRVLELRQLRSAVKGRSGSNSFNLPVFNQQLHALLDAGQSIVDSIEVLGNKDRGGRNRAIYDILLQGLQHGKQLSDAMALLPSVFPPLYVAMVRSSETTGTIRTSIKRFMLYQRQVNEIRDKLVAAAIYPAVLLGVGFVVTAFLMLYVLPRFSDVFEEVSSRSNKAPGLAQIWGTFVRDHGFLAWGGFISLAIGIVVLAVHPATRAAFSRRLLTAPWIGERIRTLQLSRMYRTLGMLLRSGVSVLAAMRMTEATLPIAMQPELRKAHQAVSEGRSMSTVMADYGLSTEVAQRLLVAGESSGNLDDMMERIADFYDEEMAAWIDTAGRLIEPALMIVIGLVIGGIVMMLYSPIFDLSNSF